MWKNTFIMPIIAKMLITLITSVDMFICTCTFSSVPSTNCDVYFVFFFLFITQTTPICNQKGEKSKKKNIPEVSQDGWRSDCVCMFLFTFSLHFVVTRAFIGLCRNFAHFQTFKRFANTTVDKGTNELP